MFVVREKLSPQARVMQSYSGTYKMHVSLAKPQTCDSLYVADGDQITFRLTLVHKEKFTNQNNM